MKGTMRYYGPQVYQYYIEHGTDESPFFVAVNKGERLKLQSEKSDLNPMAFARIKLHEYLETLPEEETPYRLRMRVWIGPGKSYHDREVFALERYTEVADMLNRKEYQRR